VRDAEALLDRLAKLAQAQNGQAVTGCAALANAAALSRGGLPLLALGASTGGPEAIAQVLAALAPRPPVPVVVVQHLAADFAPGFATWLQGRTGLSVRLAQEGTAPEVGQVDIASSNDHLILGRDQRFAYTPEPKAYPYRPSVNVLFESLATVGPRSGVAVLLTGMGSDGARGLGSLRKLGWHTIAQDEATSVVYGMPRVAAEMNAAVEVLPLPQIGAAVVNRLSLLSRGAPRAARQG
jgi:two-component system response regulator WspF